jgi:hypothetical protein
MSTSSHRLSRRRFALGTAAIAATTWTGRSARAEAATPVEITPPPVSDPGTYTAYIPTACKTGPFFHFTCEFDAAWAVLKTFGIDATLQQQLDAIVIDRRIEPEYQEREDGFVIHGGDITRAYSGDYINNFLARTTGGGMKRVFQQFGLRVAPVHDRKRVQDHLRAGRLVWIKTTVDFKDWVPVTWITPEGVQVPGVLGNDHAMVVIGYNDDVVVIRDVLGPTSSNWEREYEIEVPWDRFLTCWAAQGSDGLAVGLHDPEDSASPVAAT